MLAAGIRRMLISFDPDKPERIIDQRGLGVEGAFIVFGSVTASQINDRFDYGGSWMKPGSRRPLSGEAIASSTLQANLDL